MLRERTLSDWYGGHVSKSSSDESNEEARAQLVLNRRSVAEWYDPEEAGAMAALPSVEVPCKKYAMDHEDSDTDVPNSPRHEPLKEMYARLRHLEERGR